MYRAVIRIALILKPYVTVFKVGVRIPDRILSAL